MNKNDLVKYGKGAACLYIMYSLYKGRVQGNLKYVLTGLTAYCIYEQYRSYQEGFDDNINKYLRYAIIACGIYAAFKFMKGSLKMVIMALLAYYAYGEYKKTENFENNYTSVIIWSVIAGVLSVALGYFYFRASSY